MATLLINHLINCAENDLIFKPLEAQWIFDEPLIAKALQNVSIWFPHYSCHDVSHSKQILVHIERILGKDNISKLSATDTWLILESAYFHDIGMVIPFNHADNDYNTPEFIAHLIKMKDHVNGDTLTMLNAILSSKKEKSIFNAFGNDLSPLYAIKLFKEIIADFYRKNHPERAINAVLNPIEFGINSPRTELIPARLFGLLGKICSHHGKQFSEVMALPQRQVGIGRDDCHPRFVACLLRLGDLLDLDDNRFCPAMLKMAGNLPEKSQAHYEKHLSIRHFRADQERIEIEAECENYESYIETTLWFSWLREEIHLQMEKWFEIVPSRNFGLLPSIGNLKVHLQGWEVFCENKRPQFALDEKVFELLQGAGLYDRKECAIRELLQNAVDASLIRIWMEHNEKDGVDKRECIKESEQPYSANIINIFKKFAIKLKIDKKNEDKEFNYWEIAISDQGTGISRQDLSYMSKVGGSEKNNNRRQIIEKMPIWMKPSGIFGIGFQSIFLLTDEVTIKTRSIDTGETLEIKFTNPVSREKGNIYFRTIDSWNFDSYGCQLSFLYKSEKNSCSIKLNNGYSSVALKHYDELLDDQPDDFNILNICEEIKKFFNFSLLKGVLSFPEYSLTENFDSIVKERPENSFYSSSKKLELIDISFSHTHFFQYSYRGQWLDEHTTLNFKFLRVIVNLLDEKAGQIITINRNKLKNDSKLELSERISFAVQDFFRTDGKSYYQDKLDHFEKAIIAAEYKLQSWTVPSYFDTDWEQFIFFYSKDNKRGIGINQLKEYDSIVIYSDSEIPFENHSPEQSIDDTISNINSKHENQKKIKICTKNLGAISPLIHQFLKNNSFYPEYFIFEDKKLEVVHLTKKEKPPLSEENIKWYCKKVLEEDLSLSFNKRGLIPCLPNYNNLAFNYSINLIQDYFSLDGVSPRMIFPLAKINNKITIGHLNNLVDKVYEQRLDKNTTKEIIKDNYQKFIIYIDELMKSENTWVELRGSEFQREM